MGNSLQYRCPEKFCTTSSRARMGQNFSGELYITDEQGERVGVVLDMREYQQLTRRRTVDTDLITGLSQSELHALAFCALAPQQQARLDELLERNVDNQLSPEESAELNKLLEDIDYLNVLKTRARYTLSQQKQPVRQ